MENAGATFEYLLAHPVPSSYWLFGGKDADPNKAFAQVKQKLRETAFEMGGDDVVSCQFEYRIAGADVGLGSSSNRVVEFFAYGTVIKYVDS